MDGISALDLWDLVIEVFHYPPSQRQRQQSQRSWRVTGKPVAKNTTQHAKPNSNQAHRSQSSQH